MRKRWQAWLAETHSQQFELVRHFLTQQLVSDLFSSAEQVQRLVIGVLVGVGFAGPFMTYSYRAKYGYLHSLTTPDLYVAAIRADRLFFLSLSMVTAGLVTAVQWQGLFPNVQDYYVFKPLPVRLYRVFVARFLSAFGIVALVVLDLNVATSVVFPWICSGKWQAPSFGVQYIFAHALTTVGAGLFVFFAVAALQGTLLSLLPARVFERFSVLVQAFLATAFVTAMAYVFDIPNWHQTIAPRPHWMWFFPPAWFLGLYETLLGSGDAYFLRLGAVAIEALVAVMVIGLVAYVLSYHRHASHVLEQGRKPPRESRVVCAWAGLLRLLAPNSCERAVFAFALQTLFRSRYHKLLAGFCTGIALVLSLSTAGPILVTHLRSGQAWETWQLESILAVPLVLGAAVVLSLCYVFQIPAELRANWVFRMAEGLHRRELLNGTESLLVFCGLTPVLLVTIPIEVGALGWPVALSHSALVAALLLLFIELRLSDWHKIPFACSYLPGRSNFWQTIGKCFLLFAVLIPAVTFIEAHLLRPLLLWSSAVILGGIYLRIRSIRQGQRGLSLLLFEDVKDTALVTMQLAEPM